MRGANCADSSIRMNATTGEQGTGRTDRGTGMRAKHTKKKDHSSGKGTGKAGHEEGDPRKQGERGKRGKRAESGAKMGTRGDTGGKRTRRRPGRITQGDGSKSAS
jgi:hypothetical protein